MPKFVVKERDYGAVAEKWAALGPLVEKLGLPVKGVTTMPDQEVEYLRHKNGSMRDGVAAGRPALARDVHWCEAILALSGTTNGRLATQGFQSPRSAPARGWPTSPPSTRASDHLRRHPVPADPGHHLAGMVGQRDTADGGTRPSPSTSSGSSRGTR